MRTLVGLYMGLKKSYYTEQDGTVHEDHTAGIQDVFWLAGIIFSMFIFGGFFQ